MASVPNSVEAFLRSIPQLKHVDEKIAILNNAQITWQDMLTRDSTYLQQIFDELKFTVGSTKVILGALATLKHNTPHIFDQFRSPKKSIQPPSEKQKNPIPIVHKEPEEPLKQHDELTNDPDSKPVNESDHPPELEKQSEVDKNDDHKDRNDEHENKNDGDEDNDKNKDEDKNEDKDEDENEDKNEDNDENHGEDDDGGDEDDGDEDNDKVVVPKKKRGRKPKSEQIVTNPIQRAKEAAGVTIVEWQQNQKGIGWIVARYPDFLPKASKSASKGQYIKHCNGKTYDDLRCGLMPCRSRHVVENVRIAIIEKNGERGIACEKTLAQYPTIPNNPFINLRSDQAIEAPNVGEASDVDDDDFDKDEEEEEEEEEENLPAKAKYQRAKRSPPKKQAVAVAVERIRVIPPNKKKRGALKKRDEREEGHEEEGHEANSDQFKKMARLCLNLEVRCKDQERDIAELKALLNTK